MTPLYNLCATEHRKKLRDMEFTIMNIYLYDKMREEVQAHTIMIDVSIRLFNRLHAITIDQYYKSRGYRK